jgi:predicted AAA+ superfamily ATPase
MRYVRRVIQDELRLAVKHFPAVILTGPRRSGKTTLLRKLFPRASYVLMEDPDIIARVQDDPRGFLEEIKPPVILDEIQNVPQILNYVRTLIDRHPHKHGQWLFTGSQEGSLMKGVTESMAGRVAVFQLLPFAGTEHSKVSLLRGGFPEVLAHPSVAAIWFRSYVQTYLERDVRAISSIRDLATFRRFLSLVASRCGQILNRANMAGPLGVSVPTISEWLNILEITGHIILVPPFYENFGKRLIKSPRLYFVDSGLACYLLGIESERMLNQSPFLGPIFEGFVASEILKYQLASGRARALYYFRDQQGLEVDFLVPLSEKRLLLLESKASKTVTPAMAGPLGRLRRAISRYDTTSYLVHRGSKEGPRFAAVQPGIKALPVENLHEIILKGSRSKAR